MCKTVTSSVSVQTCLALSPPSLLKLCLAFLLPKLPLTLPQSYELWFKGLLMDLILHLYHMVVSTDCVDDMRCDYLDVHVVSADMFRINDIHSVLGHSSSCKILEPFECKDSLSKYKKYHSGIWFYDCFAPTMRYPSILSSQWDFLYY